MNPIKKLKNKRGMTLVEVLMVVALMAIMLGIAMPNILSESQKIKLATMDGYARSVAVAVQSKLYGMKNKGTAVDSSYANLNAAADEEHITVADEDKTVKYVCNFGENAAVGKQYLLSGMLTDTEILQNGKIVVIYDPDTANVLETYYSESEFEIGKLFPNANESFLQGNMIGSYLGYGAPAPERNIGLPRFEVEWKDDDEKYLELTMVGKPAPELIEKHLGLEVYALLPTTDPKNPWDPLLIYAEGIVASEYMTGNIMESNSSPASSTIKSETFNPLTLEKIQSNGGKLRFSIDSMVISSVAYDSKEVKQKLYHQKYPQYVSMTEDVLYPRDSFGNWLDLKYNPYISFGIDAGYDISDDLKTKLDVKGTGANSAKLTDYVKVDGDLELQVKLYVLQEEDGGAYKTEPIKGGSSTCTRYVRDEDYDTLVITSTNTSPYFYSFSDSINEISLASVRDLKNLKYVFETDNKINQARLYHDIDVQQFYEKLVRVRYALLEKEPSVNSKWSVFANVDTLQVDQITYADGNSNGRTGFTITGAKSDGSCYAIKNVQNGGAGWGLGGFIQYAKNIKVENLDIVNPKIWKIDYNTNFIKTNDAGNITGINIGWDSGVSGGLFGVAENCTFTNVHCYNDNDMIFKQEPWEATSYDPDSFLPAVMRTRYIGGSVAGGLVGIAIGTEGKKTTFTNCGTSTLINMYYYGPIAHCLYAGGLVGIAMGDVDIENSYAASQLSGYYSGGLVGAVVNGSFSSDIDGNGTLEANYSEVSGTLKIDNSFSAGRIERQTRVGGGLIAQIADSKLVNVSNCYSASVWEILPPIAYGTFEGDEVNYYLVQDKIAVPITLNTEAHFTRTSGDVFSLNSRSSGKAVTAANLKNTLASGWETATRTLQWWVKDNSDVHSVLLPTETGYPFPMPSGNTQFWGDWNKSPATSITGSFAATLDGFYCAYFHRGDDSYQCFTEASNTTEAKFEFNGNNLTLIGKEIKNSVTDPKDIWWASNEKASGGYVDAYGTGVAGMTDVTVANEKVTFTGAAYYNSKYNPIKGYVDVDLISTVENGSRYLNWDYYGWYIANGLYKLGYLSQSAPGEQLSNSAAGFTVEEETFKKAIGYGDFVFDTSDAKLVYDGYFHVQEDA